MSQAGHSLDVEGIMHRFESFVAVRDINLSVAGGELVALLGPSGCGKSTLLRIISGFIRQTAGAIRFDGASVDHLGPKKRGVGIVFQNYALFPHLTIRRNIAYGLEAQKWPRDRIAARVDDMLDLVHMRGFADRLPRQLSGGQQQRVALARCLAVDPKLLLLDEPFGALDKSLRLDMQIEVKRLQREFGITTILVTHDQEEALSMADRIAVMHQGRIEQVASPTEIYDRPATLFVNRFVGSTNILPATLVAASGDGSRLRLDTGDIIAAASLPALPCGARVALSIRPERLVLSTSPGENRLSATVKTVLPLGPQVIYDLAAANGISLRVNAARSDETPLLPRGSTVFVSPSSPAACQVFADHLSADQ